VGSPKEVENSDRALLAAMIVGDAEALRDLSARYGRRLAMFANRFLGDLADAEEVAADVLWQAWREAGSFDPARASVAAWLTMIARSRSLDRLRARKARPVLAGQISEPVASSDPAAELDQAERGRIVRQEIARLDANERAVLELAYFSDLSQSEIARRLAMPLGTVKTRIRNAMIRLREVLAEPGK
jgi:RNA polymerase sigma-70 factor, ECF subfamily